MRNSGSKVLSQILAEKVASTNRARTQKVFWTKEKRNLMHEAKAYRVKKVKSQSFNAVSGWRRGITLLVYLCGYAIAYSFSHDIID